MRISKLWLAAAIVPAFLATARAAMPDGEAALSAAFRAESDGLRAALAAAPRRQENPAAQPPSPEAWRALVAKVVAKGEYAPADQLPATYGLKDIQGPADAAHLANYINVWGYADSHGVFQPAEVSLVSEYWSIPADGNWHIDQWLFRLGTDASISARAHITLVETRDGQVLQDDAEVLKDEDPRIRSKYVALLDHWSGFQPRAAACVPAAGGPTGLSALSALAPAKM